VDYAGQTMPVTDPKTARFARRSVRCGVGCQQLHLCRSHLDAEPVDWIHSHVRAFEFFDGTSQLVIPDNLKSGVKKPCYTSRS